MYGVMAEFDSVQALVDASTQAVAAGYTVMEAYSPIPVEELNDIIHKKRTKLSRFVLVGGLSGMAAGFSLQYWASVIEYPMNIGGRPFFSWPAFIPITFEGMVLGAAYSAVFGLIAICGLPLLYHPVFNTPGFERATLNGFFLCIEAKDPQYDAAKATTLLKSIGATAVNEISE